MLCSWQSTFVPFYHSKTHLFFFFSLMLLYSPIFLLFSSVSCTSSFSTSSLISLLFFLLSISCLVFHHCSLLLRDLLLTHSHLFFLYTTFLCDSSAFVLQAVFSIFFYLGLKLQFFISSFHSTYLGVFVCQYVSLNLCLYLFFLLKSDFTHFQPTLINFLR